MPSIHKLTQRILDLLEELGYASLKDLFWTELGYTRVAAPLSRRGWPDPERELLAEDPVLLASAGEGGGFHVLYCRMAAERLSVSEERHVVTRLLREHPYSLFVFSNRAQDAWHFVNVKIAVPWEGEEAQEPGRKRLFRRISVERNELNRTGAERLTELEVERFPTGDHASPLVIQEIHDHAFDVDKVTRAFYQRYREVFDRVEGLIEGFENAGSKRLFTQRLFNRLMFVAFLQKKGWLEFAGSPRVDHLYAMWEAYGRRPEEPRDADNFYRDRLLLFYRDVLNAERYEAAPDRFVALLVGTGPYLNGGLFEEDDLDRTLGVRVPDAAIHDILYKLFAPFNFTITEASPLEVEVAVDPEMLGKVFEELVTDRHEKGSYYTPKPIVSFMCREALKGYLSQAVPQESSGAVAQFVDSHDPTRLRDGEAVLQALRIVRVCDPACGSGAYLLGMLHELLDLREALFKTSPLDTLSVYARKREIIQNNLYGVDIDPFAVDTARLRLWLSLIVDFERTPGARVPPLPNLDFKIEKGDSLATPWPAHLGFVAELVDRLRQAKDAYAGAHGAEKKVRLAEIQELKAALASWAHFVAPGSGFNWWLEFAEVFVEESEPPAPDEPAPGIRAAGSRPGGFDIVLANPPYVRQELIRDLKLRLAANFPQVYAGTADLYVFFYARAMELLAPGGTLVFISSNKWFRAAYGKKLRKHLGETAHVLSITDFGDLPVFESASAYPMIFVAEKRSGADRSGVLFAQPKSLDPPYPDIQAVLARTAVRLPPQAVQGSEWLLAEPGSAARTARMAGSGVPLAAYVRGRIYYGVKTGLNNAFVIDAATRAELLRLDPAGESIIKPLLHGKDVHRWRADAAAEGWLIFTRRGTDIDRYPAVKEHLERWRRALEPKPRKWTSEEKWPGRKPGAYRWFEIQDEVAYHHQFEAPKIVFPDIAKEPRFAFDRSGAFVANTGYIIPVEDFYLLGVLNSSAVERFYADISSQVRGGYLRFIRQYVERVPIPHAGPRDREAVAELAQHCVDAGSGDAAVVEWEAEIDDRVATLYGLTARERAA